MSPQRCPAVRSLVVAVLILASAGPQAAAEPFDVALSGTVGALHDENFFRVSDPVEEKSLASVGLTLKVGYEEERTDFQLRWVPSFRREWDDPHYQAHDQRLYLSLNRQTSERTQVRFDDRLIWSETDAFSLEDDLLVLAVVPQTERLGNAFMVEVDHELSPRSALVVGAHHEWNEYETVELFDSETVGGSLAGAWRGEDGREMRLIGRLFRHDPSELQPTDVASVGVRYLRPLARWHELVLEGGGFLAQGPAEVQAVGRSPEEEETGWYGSIGYSWGNSRPYVASVQIRRDVAPGVGVGFSTVANGVGLQTSWSPRRHLRFDLGGRATRHTFLFGRELETDALLGEARVHWLTGTGATLTAGIAHVNQESDAPLLDDLDYNRYSVGLSVPLLRRGRSELAPEVPE